MIKKDYLSSAKYISKFLTRTPDLAIILGSGLSSIEDMLKTKTELEYKNIPGFPNVTTEKQNKKLAIGYIGNKYVMIFCGRLHCYEGYDVYDVAHPIRVLKTLGIKKLIITNAAGGINSSLSVGDIMLISDHVMLYKGPLMRENDTTMGDRHFDMCEAYSPSMRELAYNCSKSMGITLKSGVYAYMPGPQFETPAEIRALSVLGADAVGMSTVPEVIEATHCGINVLGFSIISNLAAGISKEKLSDDDVVHASNMVSDVFTKLLNKIIEES